MSTGPISKDGKHQWNGEEWVPIPPPPKSKLDRVHGAFQIVLVFLVAIVALGVLVAIFG